MQDLRGTVLNFRVRPKERQLIKVMCLREQMNFSELMRELIREGAERRGLAAIGLIDVLDEWRKAGENEPSQ